MRCPRLAWSLLLVPCLCAGCDPSTVIEAQIPATIAADLTPPPPQANVTVQTYKILLDGVVANSIAVSACPAAPAKCTITFVVGAYGNHAVTYVYTSQLLDVDPTATVDSAPSQPTPFKLQAPSVAPAVVPAVHKVAGS